MSRKFYLRSTNIALVNDAIYERINKGREDSHANTLSWKSFVIVIPHQNIICKNCWCWTRKENVMIYFCSYSHRSYIAIDPSTCGECPLSLLPKIPHQVEILLVHTKTLKPSFLPWVSTILTYGLNKILQVSSHRCIKQ